VAKDAAVSLATMIGTPSRRATSSAAAYLSEKRQCKLDTCPRSPGEPSNERPFNETWASSVGDYVPETYSGVLKQPIPPSISDLLRRLG
jgi:hypothetical protein